jgi:hypothetical protein
MPSKSKKQHNFMEMIANNPTKAKELGVPQSVGKDFEAADKGKKVSTGARPDLQKVNKPKTDHGKMSMFNKGGKTMEKESKAESRKEMKEDTAQDKALIKKAFKMHDKQEHKGGKGTNLTKLCRGGGIESKGKTKGRMA